MKFQDSLEMFLQEVGNILTGTAEQKGYASNSNGGRDFYDAVSTISGEEKNEHACGEIVYKIKRFQAKKDPVDLVKIAAWAFLIWDKNNRSKEERE